MVCIYCSSKTQVTNSRPQKRSNQVWRRRECLQCHAVFTTEEVVQYSSAWTVWNADKVKPFSRDKLFLSIYNSLRHRPDPLADASGLTETVIKKLPEHIDGISITPLAIKQVVQVALNRFDKAASVQYQAMHP